MQLHLPIFSKEARHINDHVGVYEKDRLEQYYEYKYSSRGVKPNWLRE